MSTITQEVYAKLSFAYNYFNEQLFGGMLPDCLIVLSDARRDAKGTYEHDAFAARNQAHADRIACVTLNPDAFVGRTDRQIYSTLVHEMVHEWQYYFGLKLQPGTHNAEWADKMESLGLIPSTTGGPGGKRTGKRVTHYIEMGGPYDVAFDKIAPYVAIDWQSREAPVQPKPERPVTVKLVCPHCEGVEARATESVKLLCAECESPLIDYRLARKMTRDGGRASRNF